MKPRASFSIAGLLLAASTIGASAQINTQAEPPFVYGATVGTSPGLVLPQLTNRRSVTFCNPNATATIAVCPVRERTGGTALTCAVNGAGSVTIPPSACWSIANVPGGTGLSTAWNAVASAGASKITVFDTQ